MAGGWRLGEVEKGEGGKNEGMKDMTSNLIFLRKVQNSVVHRPSEMHNAEVDALIWDF